MVVRAYDWLDWSDGWKAYLQSKSELDKEQNVSAIHIGSSGNRDAVESVNSDVFDSEPLRREWTTFVSELVEPQLACHAMRFVTLTFRDIRDAPPTLTHGRREMESFLLKLRKEVDSFIFVEERGAENARLHYHGLIRYNYLESSQMLILSLFQDWKLSNGFFKYEEPKSQAGAISYTIKYVLKGAYSGDTAFWAKRSDAVTQIKMELK